MEKAIAIKTPIGIFKNFRDGIILNRIEWKGSKIMFSCNITDNSIIGEIDRGQEYNFYIVFNEVISLFHSELDTYCAIENEFIKAEDSASIFEEIENSNYIKKLPIRLDWGEIRHYCLSTYDDIFNIIAKSYTFLLLNNIKIF
ncbi:hypothetical protein [Leptospira noguchii]|uniref:Uncharacterized protein n=2 Tax=Leptospira noguchii TaxID=28182 RepID=M6UHT2_9LEPT|nr:hypothetical protein [Leptospira noguchii]EMO42366.1 hypothetical protein LEP1GSC186_4538 [Leptospira noguchii serovar Autumnalis str. ZUN142]UOG41394.1 hypothetical protein MAL05_16630 [Leptospira noguchii]UOG56495.1 hypothetical protein MAL03_17160 [Leptospira noguchii]